MTVLNPYSDYSDVAYDVTADVDNVNAESHNRHQETLRRILFALSFKLNRASNLINAKDRSDNFCRSTELYKGGYQLDTPEMLCFNDEMYFPHNNGQLLSALDIGNEYPFIDTGSLLETRIVPKKRIIDGGGILVDIPLNMIPSGTVMRNFVFINEIDLSGFEITDITAVSGGGRLQFNTDNYDLISKNFRLGDRAYIKNGTTTDRYRFINQLRRDLNNEININGTTATLINTDLVILQKSDIIFENCVFLNPVYIYNAYNFKFINCTILNDGSDAGNTGSYLGQIVLEGQDADANFRGANENHTLKDCLFIYMGEAINTPLMTLIGQSQNFKMLNCDFASTQDLTTDPTPAIIYPVATIGNAGNIMLKNHFGAADVNRSLNVNMQTDPITSDPPSYFYRMWRTGSPSYFYNVSQNIPF